MEKERNVNKVLALVIVVIIVIQIVAQFAEIVKKGNPDLSEEKDRDVQDLREALRQIRVALMTHWLAFLLKPGNA